MQTLLDKFGKASTTPNDQIEQGDDEVEQYSIRETSKMPYDVQLDLIENKKLNGNNSLYIGNANKLSSLTNIPNYPFVMNQGDYRKSRRRKENNKKRSAHDVPKAFFEELNKYIDEAPMVIDNGDMATIITAYPMVNENGDKSFVVVGVWKNQTIGGEKVNLIKSAYPWEDFSGHLKVFAEKHSISVLNAKKVENMLASIGIQFAEAQTILNFTDNSLPQNPDSVNTQNDKNLEQEQLRTKPLTDTEVLRMAMDRLDTDEYTTSEKVTIKSLNEKLDKLAELEAQRTELVSVKNRSLFC